MVSVSNLPRDPVQALEQILVEMIASYAGVKAPIQTFLDQRHQLYISFVTDVTIAMKCAERIRDKQVRALMTTSLRYKNEELLSEVAVRLTVILEAVVSLRLDDHFFPAEGADSFDQASISETDRTEIVNLMAQARKLTLASLVLSDGHKRRLIYRISQVENELHKEKSMFGTVMAAAYEVSGLVRQFGSDVQPIADAIEKARTITEKKVVGYQQIGEDPKPKALPKPESTE